MTPAEMSMVLDLGSSGLASKRENLIADASAKSACEKHVEAGRSPRYRAMPAELG